MNGHLRTMLGVFLLVKLYEQSLIKPALDYLDQFWRLGRMLDCNEVFWKVLCVPWFFTKKEIVDPETSPHGPVTTLNGDFWNSGRYLVIEHNSHQTARDSNSLATSLRISFLRKGHTALLRYRSLAQQRYYRRLNIYHHRVRMMAYLSKDGRRRMCRWVWLV